MDATNLLRCAETALDLDDRDGAVDLACRAYAAATSPELRTRAAVIAARAHVAKGLTSDAAAWLDDALRHVGDDTEALAWRGWTHQALEQLDRAAADLERALPAAGAVAYLHRALLREKTKDLGGAAADLAQIPDGTPHSVIARQVQVRVLDALGDAEGACAALLAAARAGNAWSGARLLERVPSTQDASAWIGAARERLDRGDPNGALARLDKLLARDDLSASERSRAYQLRGLAHNRCKRYDDAVTAYREAHAVAEGNDKVGAGLELGFALWIAGHAEEAVAAFDGVIAADPTRFWAHHRRGLALCDLDRLAEAEAAFTAALALDPCHVQPLCERARVRLALGRVDDARDDLAGAANRGSQTALEIWRERELDGDLPSAHVENAITCLQYGHNVGLAEGHYTRALDGFLAASKAPGDWAWRHAAMALSNRGYCKLEQGRHADAVADVRRAVEMRPGFRDAWNNLGNALKGTGQLAEAIAAYERAAACDPGYADAWYNRADAFNRLGRGDDAIAALDRAIAIGYPEGEERRLFDAHYNRARTHQALGHWDAAAEDYWKLDELGSTDGALAAAGVARIAALVAKPAGNGDAFSFRFYGAGAAPDEDYAVLRLQFASAPTGDTRARIVAAIAAATGELEDAEGDGPLLEWADRFALLTVPTRDPETDHELLVALIRQIAELSPLVEVVAWHAIGVSEDPWEVWSIRKQPVPDAGPRFAGPCRFWVGAIAREDAFAKPTRDDELVLALDEARTRAARAAAAAVAEAAVARGEIALVPIDDTTDQPVRPPLPRDPAGLRRDPSDHVVLAPSGAGLILRRHEGHYPGVARVTAAGEVHEVISIEGELPILMRHIRASDVRPDGRYGLVAKSDGAYRIDLETGAMMRAFDPRTPNNYIDIESACFLAGDRIAIKTGRQLLIYATDVEGGRPITAVDTDGGPVTVHHDRRVIIHGSVGEPNLTIYGLIDDRIERLAVVLHGDVNPYSIDDIGGRIFGRGDCAYEIVNIPAAYERLVAWVQAQAGKDAQLVEAAARGTPTARRVDRYPPHGIMRPIGAFKTDWYQQTPSGRAWGLRFSGGNYVVVVGDASGVRELDVEIRGQSFPYSIGPGGDHLLVVQQGAVWSVDLVAATGRRLCDARGATKITHTSAGFALGIGKTVEGYTWSLASTASPVKAWSIDGAGGDLGWLAEGRVLLLGGKDRAAVVALDDNRLYPIGTLPFGTWHVAWTVEGVTYVQVEEHDGPARPYVVVEPEAALRAALATRPLRGTLDFDALTPFAIAGDAAYDGTTTFDLAGSHDGDDDYSDDEDDMDEDEDEDEEGDDADEVAYDDGGEDGEDEDYEDEDEDEEDDD